ncbi:P83/100 family protein [Spirochaetota bacterium]
MMKKIGVGFLALALLALSATALDVDSDEMSSVQGQSIEFINYEGPQAVIETAESIRSIGQTLGAAVRSGVIRTGAVGRYSVIHAIDPSVDTGFDADIILIGEGARVDHIRNLRRIVSGYLQEAYGYSVKDADTLAIFITIYNAVYRGKLDYFQGKYKPIVMKELSANNVGLSVRWDEWAGRSRIVAPLSAGGGTNGISAVATTPITDKPTVDSLKAESSSAGVAERMDVVDIKEREQEQEKAAIAVEKAKIEAEEKALADDKAKAEATKPATTGTTDAEGQPAAKSGDTATGQDDAAAKGDDQQASIAVSEKARAEETAAKEAAAADIAEREAKVEADKAALAKREESAAAKDAEIAADRADIATDQKTAIQEQVAAASAKDASGIPLFDLVDPNAPYSRIALVDLTSGETLRRSTINSIRANTAIDMKEYYIVVAGQLTGAGGAVRLVRISKADYADVQQGNDDVFADTMLWKLGAWVYAVVKKGDGWAIGRFDPATLELKASSEPVSRWTQLTAAGERLVAQGPKGKFLVLEAESLKTSSEIAR